MNNSRAAIAAVGVVMMATFGAPATAQDSAFYVGGYLAHADYKAAREQDTGWGLLAGYEFTPNYSLEVGYADLGKLTDSAPGIGSLSLGTTAFEIAGIGAFEVTDRFSMYGRFGAYRADTKMTLDLVGFDSESERERNTDITYGIGARFNLSSNLVLRGAYQRYHDVGDITDIDVLSVAILARF